MSYSSITTRKQLKELEDIQEYEETQEYQEQQIIDEYNNQQSIKNKKNKNKYKNNNEETYNRNINNTNGDDQNLNKYNPDFCVVPPIINIYNKKFCIKWLTYNLDNNYYHYDYCIKLFEMLMKWVRYNNFVLKTGEQPLLGKFISLMYLLSNKKDYRY